MTAKVALPRPSWTTPARTTEGRGSAPTPTPKLPPSPLRTPPPTPTENQLREEPPEDCSVCYEALASPLVYLGSCSHRLHLSCYAALQVRAGADLRCPACRATVTVHEADRMALHQHSNEFMVEVLTVAWQEMSADGEARLTTRSTTGDRRRRAICSVCHCLVEEPTCAQVPCSCDVHRRCALGFREDAISRARTLGGVHLVTCPNQALDEELEEVDLHPLLQQIRALGRSVDTTEEYEIRHRVTAAEQRLLKKRTLPHKWWIYCGVARRETRRTTTENGGARSPSNKCERRVGSVAGTWRMIRGSLLVAGSSTGGVP